MTSLRELGRLRLDRDVLRDELALAHGQLTQRVDELGNALDLDGNRSTPRVQQSARVRHCSGNCIAEKVAESLGVADAARREFAQLFRQPHAVRAHEAVEKAAHVKG